MENIVINKEERCVWLDALKGFGIILIMLNHTGIMPRWAFLLTAGYVSLFFVAAGYTFNPKSSFSEEIKKKIKRLITPYFFWGIIGVFITCLIVALEGEQIDFFGKILGLCYSRYSTSFRIESGLADVPMLKAARISPMWFLTSLFTSFTAVIPLLKVKSSKIRYWLILLYIIISIAMTHLPILLPWSIDTALVGALLIYWGTKRVHLSSDVKSFVLLTILYCGLLVFEKTNNFSVRQYGWHNALSVVPYIIVGIIEVDLMISFLKRFERTMLVVFLSKVGKCSLVLMCIHAPIYTVLRASGLQSDTWMGGGIYSHRADCGLFNIYYREQVDSFKI